MGVVPPGGVVPAPVVFVNSTGGIPVVVEGSPEPAIVLLCPGKIIVLLLRVEIGTNPLERGLGAVVCAFSSFFLFSISSTLLSSCSSCSSSSAATNLPKTLGLGGISSSIGGSPTSIPPNHAATRPFEAADLVFFAFSGLFALEALDARLSLLPRLALSLSASLSRSRS